MSLSPPTRAALVRASAVVALALVGLAPLAAAQDATPVAPGSPAATPVASPAARVGLPAPATPAAGTPVAGVAGATLVATGLANPRGVAVGPDGTVYVAEAGLGGNDAFETPLYGPSTRGATGRVTALAPDGTATAVAVGLPSFALGGNEAIGPSGIAVDDEGAVWLATAYFVPELQPRPNEAALLQIDPEMGTASIQADLGSVERESNPDGFVIESDPYGVAVADDGAVYVADAGANVLYRFDPAAEEDALELVTVFDGLPGEQPNPARNGAAELDPVPTGVAPAPDGGVYVGFLGGFPFPPGAAKVVLVSEDGTVSDAATGLTAVVDVAVGPDGLLYVTEFASGFDLEAQQPSWIPDSGRVLRVLADGTTEVVADGLNSPNGIAFGADGELYVVVNSNTPPQAGPQGQLLRIDGVAEAADGGATPAASPAA
jgi:glucose/arabinose dehydrogenase